MKKAYLLLLLPLTCSADTNWLQVASNTAIVGDWMQTRSIVGNDIYCENNPILGTNPSASQINQYFAGVLILNNVIGELLPPKYSDMFYVGVTSVQTMQILKNYQVGVKFKF